MPCPKGNSLSRLSASILVINAACRLVFSSARSSNDPHHAGGPHQPYSWTFAVSCAEMFRGSSMGIGAGPLYTNAIMGQTLTPAERENARKASSTILREDRIQIEESESVSRPDSYSIHCNYTDQAPYSTGEDGTMMTQKSLLHIPSDNPSHDLALFLRLTGPTQPHRRPNRLENGERSVSGRGRSLRFLRLKRRRSLSPSTMTRDR